MPESESVASIPAVDELFDPQSPRYMTCPYEAYAVSRASVPVAHHQGFDEWIVTGHEEIDAILRDHARFTSRHNLEGSYPLSPECKELLDRSLFFDNAIYNVDPPVHTRFRALISHYFSARNLRRLEPSIRAIAKEQVGNLTGSPGGDLLKEFASPLPLRVICELIGIPAADRATVKGWNDAWLALQVAPLAPEQQVHCAHALLTYEDYLRDLLAQRRLQPGEDLATGLLQAAVDADPVCTLDEAVVAIRFMIAAGHETTGGLIGNAVYRLLEDRRRWEAMVRDPGLIEAAVEETLRFDTPAQGALRVATEDVRVGATALSAGARLRVMLAAPGRDPDRIEDPDTFRLDREGTSRHIGFGLGIHYCAGASLARLEARVALETLAETLPELHLDPAFEPQYQPGGFIFHSLTALPVRWA